MKLSLISNISSSKLGTVGSAGSCSDDSPSCRHSGERAPAFSQRRWEHYAIDQISRRRSPASSAGSAELARAALQFLLRARRGSRRSGREAFRIPAGDGPRRQGRCRRSCGFLRSRLIVAGLDLVDRNAPGLLVFHAVCPTTTRSAVELLDANRLALVVALGARWIWMLVIPDLRGRLRPS